MEISTILLRSALAKAFEEGLCGYAEMKDQLVDSLISDLISASDKEHNSGYSVGPMYCSGAIGSTSYSYSTMSIPSVTHPGPEDLI
jgi:hypothetical protein